MKSDSTSIQHLNQVFACQLQTINQFFIHGKIFQHQGLLKLAAKEQLCSAAELQCAHVLAERILLLLGTPNMAVTLKAVTGIKPEELLAEDLKQAEKSVSECKKALIYLDSVRDYGSSAILKQNIAQTEQNIAWFEVQLGLIKSLGLQSYLQQQL